MGASGVQANKILPAPQSATLSHLDLHENSGLRKRMELSVCGCVDRQLNLRM